MFQVPLSRLSCNIWMWVAGLGDISKYVNTLFDVCTVFQHFLENKVETFTIENFKWCWDWEVSVTLFTSNMTDRTGLGDSTHKVK